MGIIIDTVQPNYIISEFYFVCSGDGRIVDGLFKERKPLTDAAKYLYIDGKPEAVVLEGVLGEVVKEGKLTVENEKYLKNN